MFYSGVRFCECGPLPCWRSPPHEHHFGILQFMEVLPAVGVHLFLCYFTNHRNRWFSILVVNPFANNINGVLVMSDKGRIWWSFVRCFQIWDEVMGVIKWWFAQISGGDVCDVLRYCSSSSLCWPFPNYDQPPGRWFWLIYYLILLQTG